MRPSTLKGVFHRYDPQVAPIPLVLDVSHSGTQYPPQFRSSLPFTILHDNVSMYVDELWWAGPDVGATLLYCCFPHTFVDVNRREDDIDQSWLEDAWPGQLAPSTHTLRGLGLIRARSRYGEPIQEGPGGRLRAAEVEARLADYYRPYHQELAEIIRDTQAAHGRVWHFSLHCMSDVGAPTHEDAGQPRSDFCLGNIHGQTSSQGTLDFLAKQIRDLGYTVSINAPYAGEELNRRYGDPAKGVDSIIIEINKRLFMDIRTFQVTPGFYTLRDDLGRLLDSVRIQLGVA